MTRTTTVVVTCSNYNAENNDNNHVTSSTTSTTTTTVLTTITTRTTPNRTCSNMKQPNNWHKAADITKSLAYFKASWWEADDAVFVYLVSMVCNRYTLVI